MEYLKPKFSLFTGSDLPRRQGDVREFCPVCGACVVTDSKDPTWRPAHRDERDAGKPVVKICFWRE